jgi:hypothetical protein
MGGAMKPGDDVTLIEAILPPERRIIMLVLLAGFGLFGIARLFARAEAAEEDLRQELASLEPATARLPRLSGRVLAVEAATSMAGGQATPCLQVTLFLAEPIGLKGRTLPVLTSRSSATLWLGSAIGKSVTLADGQYATIVRDAYGLGLAAWGDRALREARAGEAGVSLPADPGPAVSYVAPEVKLRGTLWRQVFPGPPDFESVATGDTPEICWVLGLARQVDVVGLEGDDINSTERKVREVQLVFAGSSGLVRPDRPSPIGSEVIVTGQLSHATSGRRRTAVLIEVSEVQAATELTKP